jgi:putative Holliday junction resolvase
MRSPEGPSGEIGIVTTGRILGIDAGERRIGIAISDPDRHFALPLNSVLADGNEIDAIQRLSTAEEVTELVIGLPLSLSGAESAQTSRVREFAAKVEARLQLPVHLWDERLSTHEAQTRSEESSRARGRRRSGRRAPPPVDTDALAASIILQAYLDRLRYQ